MASTDQGFTPILNQLNFVASSVGSAAILEG
jgi:hypothetical protein